MYIVHHTVSAMSVPDRNIYRIFDTYREAEIYARGVARNNIGKEIYIAMVTASVKADEPPITTSCYNRDGDRL